MDDCCMIVMKIIWGNKMSKIKIGSHVKMAGKEMFLASVKEAICKKIIAVR